MSTNISTTVSPLVSVVPVLNVSNTVDNIITNTSPPTPRVSPSAVFFLERLENANSSVNVNGNVSPRRGTALSSPPYYYPPYNHYHHHSNTNRASGLNSFDSRISQFLNQHNASSNSSNTTSTICIHRLCIRQNGNNHQDNTPTRVVLV